MRIPVPRSSRRHSVLQQHATDCGAACLATVARFYGKKASVAKLRLLCGTDRNGTNVFGMVAAAKAMGFACQALRCEPESLPQLEMPAIAHVVRGQWKHFVVLHRVDHNKCLIADPGEGLRIVSRKTFLSEWTGVAITLRPEQELTVPEANSVLSYLRELAEPYDFVLAEILLANIVLLFLMLGGSLYLRMVVDRLLQQHDASLLPCMGWTLLGIFAWRAAFGAIRSVLVAHTSRRIDTMVLQQYLRQLLHVPLSFFQACEPGDILSRVGDIFRVRELISGTTLGLLIDGASVLLSMCVLAFLNWHLALLATAVVGPVVLVLSLVSWPLKRSQRLALEAGSQLQSTFSETYSGIATIKSLGGERLFLERAEEKIGSFAYRLYRINLLCSFSGGIAELAVGAVATFVIWQSLKSAMAGHFTLGGFVAFFSIFYAMLQPLLRVMNSSIAVGEAIASLDRLNDIMQLGTETKPAHTESTDTRPVEPLAIFAPQQHVVFQNVSFSYGCRAPVLKKLTLTLLVGRMTAVVGDSGGGKTTIARLLLRHFDPSEGSILVDGTPLTHFSLGSVRQNIGYVEQEPYIFQGTLLENLVFGCERITQQQLKEVLNSLNLTSLISTLPQGLQTIVGDRGVSLSGGQRQRVALARALLRQPRLLLLDEPSSSLDAVNDRFLQQVIETMRGRCTIIIITHRLSTVQNADQILFIKDGVLAEQGTHPELLRGGKAYARHWGLQENSELRQGSPSPYMEQTPGGMAVLA